MLEHATRHFVMTTVRIKNRSLIKYMMSHVSGFLDHGENIITLSNSMLLAKQSTLPY